MESSFQLMIAYGMFYLVFEKKKTVFFFSNNVFYSWKKLFFFKIFFFSFFFQKFLFNEFILLLKVVWV